MKTNNESEGKEIDWKQSVTANCITFTFITASLETHLVMQVPLDCRPAGCNLVGLHLRSKQ